MNLGFPELIGSIESELSTEYIPGAIRWSDDTHNNAWSNALDRFDKALALAIERKDYLLAKVEGDFYKATILDLIGKYKSHKCLDDIGTFLKSING